MKSELTPSDYAMIRYFIKEKGDITRWVGWEEARFLVAQKHPELIKALDDLAVAKRILECVVNCLPNEDH